MDIEELREYYFAELMPSAPSKEHLEYAKNEQDLENEINSQYGEQFDIRRLMDEAHDPLTGTLRDLRIDDRDLPTAKNYFDFCYNYLSGNVPWSRQMWSMLKFFGEICPHPKCSDRRWLNNVLNIPKDFPTKDLPERLTFLEHGVCPKCKRNKRQLIKHGRMMNYKEAVFVWGQRCVTGDTLVVTSNGLEYIGDIAKGKAKGFQEFKQLVHNGKELEESSHFYVAPNKERVHKIKLSSGAVIKGTKDHPLMTSTGFKRSEDIQVGDYVQQVVGTNQWGTSSLPISLDYVKAYIKEHNKLPPRLLNATEEQAALFIASYKSQPFQVFGEALSGLLSVFANFGYVAHCSNGQIFTVGKRHITPHAVLMLVTENALSKSEYTTYDFTLPKTHQFVANGILNHNSGKSTTVTSGSAYHLHRFLKFPVFGTMTNLMQASTPLTMTFVSLTYGKAYAVLWEPFTNFITESPWFNQYFEMLDYHGNKYGKELYAYKKEFIKFFHKKLNLAPSHPDKSILRGETRFGAAIDELGLFPLPKGDEEEDEESQRANADEAHKSLTNSLTTVQSVADMLLQQGHFHVPNGYMFGVSSPFSERDKVMRLLKDSRGEEGRKFIFGSQLATWEINPGIHRDSPMIALAYEKNFEKADRDFGANPPRVDSPYIQSDVIREGVFEGKRNSHLLTYTFTPKYIGGTIRQVADVLLPTCLSLDAGEVDNSFAITGTSYDFKTGKTIVHTVLEVIPQQGLRINHDNLYTTVILPLAKALNVRAVVADRWNSLNILHRLENDLPWEVYIRQISPRRDDFDMFTKMLIDKTVILPRPEIAIDKLLEAEVEDYRTFFLNKPVAHLAHQITTVREVSPVKPPEKGTGYTDDTFRATILGATKIHLPKIKEILEKAEKTSRATVKRSGAVFISRSGF